MHVLNNSQFSTQEVRTGLIRRIVYTPNLMSAILNISGGPWSHHEEPHYNPHEQTCYIVSGEIIFFCEDEPEQNLQAGDMLFVPSGKKHTIRFLTKTARLVDSFYPLREDFL